MEKGLNVSVPTAGMSYLCYASQTAVHGDVISGLNIDRIPLQLNNNCLLLLK